MPNPSAIILPMEPQPPEGYRSMTSSSDNSGGWWFSDMPRMIGTFEMSEFAKWNHFYPKCSIAPNQCKKIDGKVFLVRTVEARRVDSLTEEELTGLARHGAGQAWVWLLKGEVVNGDG